MVKFVKRTDREVVELLTNLVERYNIRSTNIDQLIEERKQKAGIV